MSSVWYHALLLGMAPLLSVSAWQIHRFCLPRSTRPQLTPLSDPCLATPPLVTTGPRSRLEQLQRNLFQTRLSREVSSLPEGFELPTSQEVELEVARQAQVGLPYCTSECITVIWTFPVWELAAQIHNECKQRGVVAYFWLEISPLARRWSWRWHGGHRWAFEDNLSVI